MEDDAGEHGQGVGEVEGPLEVLAAAPAAPERAGVGAEAEGDGAEEVEAGYDETVAERPESQEPREAQRT